MSVLSALRPARPAWLTPSIARTEILARLAVAAAIRGGAFQVLLPAAGVARLMRFIPRSVMVGFVNALAILIFSAQLPHLIDVPWLAHPLLAVPLLLLLFLP